MSNVPLASSCRKRVSDPARIPTPALVLDLTVADANVRRMADYAAQHRLHLRPHTKTHKSREMGQLQLAHGAVGLTVAKVGEAQVMSSICEDLLIAFPAIDPHRVNRIAELAREVTVRVAVDSMLAVDALADGARRAGATIGILVDLDVGFHRTGVQSAAEALAIAQHVDQTIGVRLDGLFFFPGHIRNASTDKLQMMAAIESRLREVIDRLEAHGLPVPIVSGGSTPTAYDTHHMPSVTEMRPGTYVYNDVHCIADGLCDPSQCAASVIATVVSNAVRGKVVVDAGSKSLTPEQHTARTEFRGFGYVIDLPRARVVRVTEEHGEIDVSNCDHQPRLGERLRIVPVHICPSVNLHDDVWLARSDGTYESVPVSARGRVI